MKHSLNLTAAVSAFFLGACMSADVPAADEGDGKGDIHASRVEINATLKCPIPGAPGVDPAVSTAAVYLAAPGFETIKDCDHDTMGPLCTSLIMTRITCTWENMTLAGQPLTESLWHGQGFREGDIAIAQEGNDSGIMPNGDRYLSRWSEFQLPHRTIAIWTPVFGTGSLAGITGQAVIECPPAEGVSVETCQVEGWYSLPKLD